MRREVRLPARAEEIRPALDGLEAWLGASGAGKDLTLEIRLLAEEALTNIVKHGAAGRDDVEIEMAVEFGARQVRVDLRDDGPPFDPLRAAPSEGAAPPERHDEGGFGILLLRGIADEIRYERTGGYNSLVLIKGRTVA